MAEMDVNKNEKLWALFTHLSALISFIGIPFGNIFGPLVIWLIKREEMPLVDQSGREALNFQLSMTIYALVTIPLMFIVVGIPLFIALAITNVIFVVIATIRTNEGREYHYPLAIPFFKND